MIKYYFNPKNGDLVVLDTTDKDIFILEPIKSVRVVTVNDVQVGDVGTKRNLLEKPKNKRKKTKRVKLDDQQKAQIITLKEQGEKTRVIADLYGVSEATVFKVIKENKKQDGSEPATIGQGIGQEDKERGFNSL